METSRQSIASRERVPRGWKGVRRDPAENHSGAAAVNVVWAIKVPSRLVMAAGAPVTASGVRVSVVQQSLSGPEVRWYRGSRALSDVVGHGQAARCVWRAAIFPVRAPWASTEFVLTHTRRNGVRRACVRTHPAGAFSVSGWGSSLRIGGWRPDARPWVPATHAPEGVPVWLIL
jgi:hypothetical protein